MTSWRKLGKGKLPIAMKLVAVSCDLTVNLCCRAYGAVYKAMHKESGQLLAIKQVPVDSDLQDIIKEISIMQQCDRYLICLHTIGCVVSCDSLHSQYVVKYYGSYFKNTDLWIVMEYCGAGSVSDIMRIINNPVSLDC